MWKEEEEKEKEGNSQWKQIQRFYTKTRSSVLKLNKPKIASIWCHHQKASTSDDSSSSSSSSSSDSEDGKVRWQRAGFGILIVLQSWEKAPLCTLEKEEKGQEKEKEER